MASITATENVWVVSRPKSSSMRTTIASPMGIIMIAVAVLEIHIDKKAPANMKPRMMRSAPPPTVRMIQSAIRRWRFHFSIVRAIMNPPRNKTMVLLK